MKKNPTILFLTDNPTPASIDNHFILMEGGEHKPYRDAIVKPTAASLEYPNDFADPDIPDGSIAYHPIFGEITYRSWWRFSTARFMDDLKAAEENPRIAAHLLHIDSGGGEAYATHEAFLQVKSLKKPCYAVIDSMGCSAAYYLAAAADKVFTSCLFSMAGCIGIVGAFWDDTKMLEKWGITEHEYYSSYSPLKNKTFRDALKGDGEEYIRRYLDPMALQFIDDMKSVRKDISKEALQGETYYTPEAVTAGLIDGQHTLEEALELLSQHIQSIQQKSPSVDINTLTLN